MTSRYVVIQRAVSTKLTPASLGQRGLPFSLLCNSIQRQLVYNQVYGQVEVVVNYFVTQAFEE